MLNSIQSKMFAIMTCVTLVLCISFTGILFFVKKEQFLAGVDDNLYTAALMAKQLFPDDYHDKLLNEHSVSQQDYLDIIDRNNRLCMKLGLQYLWSNLFLTDKVVFTSSTSMSKDVSNGDHALFFDVHSDPAAFDAVKESLKATYSTFTNEWGRGRMILLPFEDIHGRTYVFGASMSINAVDEQLHDLLLTSIVIFFIATGLGIILLHLFTRTFVGDLEYIGGQAEDIVSGKFDIPGTVTRSSELGYLSEQLFKAGERQKQHYFEIQKQVNMLVALVENSTEAIGWADLDSTVRYFNKAIMNLLGIDEDKNISAYSFMDFYDEASLKKLSDEIMPEVNLKGYWKGELPIKAISGELIPCKHNIYLIRDADNKPLAYANIAIDLRERKAFENRLIESRQQAEQANAAKSLFLTSVSHELRTPLNSILGFCQLLDLQDKGELSEQQYQYLAEIRTSGNHLLEVVSGILDLTAIESGSMPVKLEPVSLLSVVDESAAMVRQLQLENKIELDISSIEKCDHTVVADKTRLRQVLVNLLSNAIKYNIDEGKVVLACECPDEDTVRLTITDTGKGIPENLKDKVFEPFNRLGREASNVSGAGVGLVLSRKLMEAMGGKIGFDSKSGEGSCFWIKLDAYKDSQCNNVEVDQFTSGKRNGNIPLPDLKRVLYVEDNIANIRLMEEVFNTGRNMQLLVEMTAEAGLARAREALPDLILLDINLPGDKDGLWVAQQLMTDSTTSHIPLIAVSANAFKDDIDQSLASGFEEYIIKPFDVLEVDAIISRYLVR